MEAPAIHRRRSAVWLSVKDLLRCVYLWPLKAIACHMGAASLHRLGRALTPVYQVLTMRAKQRARARMMLAYQGQLDERHLRILCREYIANAVVRALDDLHLAEPTLVSRLPAPTLEGMEHLQRALDRGQGVLLVSGHFYANRLGKRHLARIGYPILSVGNGRPRDRASGRVGSRLLLPRYLRFLSEIIGDEVLIQDPDRALKIFQRLRRGGLVNVLIDAPFGQAAVLPFLGKATPFATGLLEIVRLSDCVVIPMLCLGNQQNYRIQFGEPLTLEKAATRAEFFERNIQRLIEKLERQILEHGSEWELWTRL